MKSASLYTKKIVFLVKGFLFFLSIILVRLVYLQIIATQNFSALSVKNFLRVESISLPRGNILDCHGTLLATNRPVTTIYWQGTGNKTLTSDQEEIIEKICDILSIKRENLIRSIQFSEKTATKTLIMSDASFKELSLIIEQFPYTSNIHIETSYKRFYPYKNVASHILGHLNKIDKDPQGKMGLEKILHTQLQGQEGKLQTTINSMGSKIAETELKQALAGEDIVTTID